MAKKDDKNLTCSFCGKNQEKVFRLISGPKVYICDECIELCHEIVVEEKRKESPEGLEIPESVDKIKIQLDKSVIGHETAKLKLASAVYNHCRRIALNADEKELFHKSNILFIGPTGTGKTLMAKILSRILKVPFVVSDASKLLQISYRGEENALQILLESSGYNPNQVEKGIIYIDNIDKIACIHKNDDLKISRQAALFELMDKSIVNIQKKAASDILQIDTTDLLIICGGTFSGLEKIVQQRTMASLENDGLKSVKPVDLIAFGLLPELVGRLPIIITLDNLTESEIFKIISEFDNSILDEYKKLFEMDGICLDFTDSAIRAIAHEAYRRKSGVRGIKAVLENLALDISCDISFNKGNKSITITEEYVTKRFQ